MRSNEVIAAEIDALIGELQGGPHVFTPVWPRVLVLRLRREQKVGLVWSPDKQNKVVHEGIVLAVWKEFTEEVGRRSEDGAHLTRTVVRRSARYVGEHVLFPHFAGVPAYGWDPEWFRCVNEPEILGTLGTGPASDALEDLLALIPEGQLSAEEWQLALARIRDRFTVVDRESGSLTLSGV